jgi:hypothetical protein
MYGRIKSTSYFLDNFIESASIYSVVGVVRGRGRASAGNNFPGPPSVGRVVSASEKFANRRDREEEAASPSAYAEALSQVVSYLFLGPPETHRHIVNRSSSAWDDVPWNRTPPTSDIPGVSVLVTMSTSLAFPDFEVESEAASARIINRLCDGGAAVSYQ